MKNKYVVTFVCYLMFAAVALLSTCCKPNVAKQAEEVRYLNSRFGCVNNDWQFQYNGQWFPATVPGSIHHDLLQNDLIPDPFYGTNEDSVQWVADSVWTYRLLFDKECANASQFAHRQLVFDGLDTYAEVYLNGQRLTTTDNVKLADNMFRQWIFNLPNNLKEKNNELIVRFLPTAPLDSVGASKLSYTLPDTRVFTRKAQYESGWDWGPKLNTCGIWKNVYIRSYGELKMDDLYVRDARPTFDADGEWLCNVEFDVKADQKMRVKANVICRTPASDSSASEIKVRKRIRLKQGDNHISIPVKIEKPQLWWPNGMGAQPLYTFSITLECGGKTYNFDLQNSTIRHGLRTIELKREKDKIGESFQFIVNGKPCFMRGADWIPASSYPGTLNTPAGNDVYYRLLHDCQDVNMNMLRVWGGGIYENEAFYRYCDQLGILVWQDFMYACNPYPGDDNFLYNAKIEAIQQVKRLCNHPCIALWCGNNEVHNGLEDWGWQTALAWSESANKELYRNYSKLFEKLLPEVVKTYAGNLSYIPTSPTFGWGHPECCTYGCAHYWGVWWGEMPFEIWPEKTGRFMAEYGFQSYPDTATMNTVTPLSERQLDSPTLKNHQKHGRGVAIIQQAMLKDFNYNKTNNLGEFAYVSQLVQAEGIEQAISAHRIAHNRCSGTLFWQVNDCWPVASWSSIDYTGRWKALHYRVKELYANVTIAAHRDSAHHAIDLYLINDSLADVQGVLKYEIIDLQGNILQKATQKALTAQNYSCVKAFSIACPENQHGNAFVKAQWMVDDKVKMERVFFFDKPKDLKLTHSEIQQKLVCYDDSFELTLTSPTLQYGVQVIETSGKEVRYSDNYFVLLPNQPKKIVGYYDVAMEGQPVLKIHSLK